MVVASLARVPAWTETLGTPLLRAPPSTGVDSSEHLLVVDGWRIVDLKSSSSPLSQQGEPLAKRIRKWYFPPGVSSLLDPDPIPPSHHPTPTTNAGKTATCAGYPRCRRSIHGGLSDRESGMVGRSRAGTGYAPNQKGGKWICIECGHPARGRRHRLARWPAALRAAMGPTRKLRRDYFDSVPTALEHRKQSKTVDTRYQTACASSGLKH